MRRMRNKPYKNDRSESLSVFQMVASCLAAMLGVQSQDMRERDFSRGDILQFIAIGLVMTTFFVFALIFLVSWIAD